VAEYDRVHHQAYLVYQAQREQISRQRRAAEDRDVLARLPLELGQLRRDVVADDAGIGPAGSIQRSGNDDLGDRVHPGGDAGVEVLTGLRRPVGNHAFVGDPAEDQRVDLIELLDRVVGELLVKGLPGQAALGVGIVAVGADPHEREDFSHGKHPGWRA
jgi:hypothetical protein